jgi:hypothetical protein
MAGGAISTPGYREPHPTGDPLWQTAPRPLDPVTAHRTRTNTRTSLEPIGYDGEGAPLYAWQLDDER